MRRDVFLRTAIRFSKPFMTHIPHPLVRKFQDASGRMLLKKVKSKVQIEDNPLYIKITPDNPKKTVFMYLHGGAYTAGGTDYIRGAGACIAAETNTVVFGCKYRLAPENPFPCGLSDAFNLYKELTEKGCSVALIGESAGGGMAFSLCRIIKKNGLQMPKCIVTFSAWTDLTFSGKSYSVNKHRDISLSEKNLRRSALQYTGVESAEDELISPAFADTSGFPPVLMFAGGDEILLSDTEMMYNNLVSHGVSAEMIVHPRMWHAYPFFYVSCSKEVFICTGAFSDD